MEDPTANSSSTGSQQPSLWTTSSDETTEENPSPTPEPSPKEESPESEPTESGINNLGFSLKGFCWLEKEARNHIAKGYCTAEHYASHLEGLGLTERWRAYKKWKEEHPGQVVPPQIYTMLPPVSEKITYKMRDLNGAVVEERTIEKTTIEDHQEHLVRLARTMGRLQ